MRDLPGPGLEPLSPALASGFPTTAPQGKPLTCFLILDNLIKSLGLTARAPQSQPGHTLYVGFGVPDGLVLLEAVVGKSRTYLKRWAILHASRYHPLDTILSGTGRLWAASDMI